MYLPHSEFVTFVLQEDRKDLSSIPEICTSDAEDKQNTVSHNTAKATYMRPW